MGVYTHFGSKQGLLEQLYLHGFRRLEERLDGVPSDGEGRQELLAFALAYRAFALANEALYGLMFERATPDFVPSDASRLAGLATFEMLAQRVAAWRPDFTDGAGRSSRTCRAIRRRATRRPSARSSKRSTAARPADERLPRSRASLHGGRAAARTARHRRRGRHAARGARRVHLQRRARHDRHRRLRARVDQEVPRCGPQRTSGPRDRRPGEHGSMASTRDRDPRARRGDRAPDAPDPDPPRADRQLGPRTRPQRAHGRAVASEGPARRRIWMRRRP